MKKNESVELLRIRKKLEQQLVESNKNITELNQTQRELSFQKTEYEKLVRILDAINLEVIFSNAGKEKRADELQLANAELAYQNEEKGKRAAELVIANTELVFQNTEKEERAAELIIANAELIFQNEEREKRSAELLIANEVLVFNNTEKEKRATELILINAELETFTYISSHDLHEPLRKMCTFVNRILDTERENLSPRGKDYFDRICSSATHMQVMIDDLLVFSRLKTVEPEKLVTVNLNRLTRELVKNLQPLIDIKSATVEVEANCEINCIPGQLRLALHNLITNSLKFSAHERLSHINIHARMIPGRDVNTTLSADSLYCHISVSDNGIGFESHYTEKIFDVFKRLHGKSVYGGSGIGLAIVKRVVETHHGFIEVISEAGTGTTFHIYLPVA